MIEKITFDNGTSTIDINESDTTVYPVQNFEIEIPSRIEERERSAADGMWPTFPYEGGMEITIEGEILSNDADEYRTNRKALINTLRFKPTTRLRKNGTLKVYYSGEEPFSVDADVAIRSINVPISSEGKVTPFRIVLLSWLPYFIDHNGDPYYDA
jgi:hypothetical protein